MPLNSAERKNLMVFFIFFSRCFFFNFYKKSIEAFDVCASIIFDRYLSDFELKKFDIILFISN